MQRIHRHSQDFLIHASFVLKDQRPNRPNAHNGAWNNRVSACDQHIHRVTIFRQSVRHEAIIARVGV